MMRLAPKPRLGMHQVLIALIVLYIYSVIACLKNNGLKYRLGHTVLYAGPY